MFSSLEEKLFKQVLTMNTWCFVDFGDVDDVIGQVQFVHASLTVLSTFRNELLQNKPFDKNNNKMNKLSFATS